MKKTVLVVLGLLFVSCAAQESYQNDFSKILNTKGKWLSHDTDQEGNIELVFEERLKIAKTEEVKYIEHSYKTPRSEFDEISYFVEGKPAYYCEYRYSFNKKRELLDVELRHDTCRYIVD